MHSDAVDVGLNKAAGIASDVTRLLISHCLTSLFILLPLSLLPLTAG